MDDGVFWGACEAQQVGMFNGADGQGSLLCHAESPYQQYWGAEPWTPARPDEIHDIGSMASSLVDASSIFSIDPGVLNHAVPGDDFAAGSARFARHEPWAPSLNAEVLYPAQEVQEILNNPFLQLSSMPHIGQEYIGKSFGSINNRPVTSAQYDCVSRAVTSMAQYGSSPVQSSMAMFTSSSPRGIVNAPGMGGGGMSSNLGLMRQSAPKSGVDITASDVGSEIAGAAPFTASQKSSASVLMPLAEIHKMDAPCAEPKMASFNPGPYVNNVRVMPKHDQHESNRVWGDGSLGKNKSVAIPNLGHRQQQGVSSSSPETSFGMEVRHQQALSGSSPVTSFGMEPQHHQMMSGSSPRMGLEPRRQQNISMSSPMTHFGMEQRPKPSMGSSPAPIMGFDLKQQHQRLLNPSPLPGMSFDQRQQQSMSNSSSTPSLSFDQRQQPAVSTSPPLSKLGYEPQQLHQQPGSVTTPVSSSAFDSRRQQSTLTMSAANLSRQQPSASNARPTVPESGEPASKWSALRMAGGLGGSSGLSGSEKAPMMVQQPETGILKCALPRNSSANTCPPANPVNKRPLYPDDSKNQGGSVTKKPLNKWQGVAGCSRLEEISAAAHQKVTQTTSGRALGPALNTNLKPRARQGSANDPQSIAARVRRERISERLKVLQALIPNGDKVDMVTMLEKAINYVRCLELQIKMLKNDSLWPKALGPLPNTLQELLELAGPEFQDDKDHEEMVTEKTTKKTAPEVIEMDRNQPSADKE